MKVLVGSFAPNDQAKTVPVKLDVTGYLKDIAGFIEFPIYVEEDGRQTVILHPDRVASSGKRTDWEVVALDCSFAWQNYFVQQDVRLARDLFTEEKITIKPNAKNPLFEGIISFPVLKEDIELRPIIRGFHYIDSVAYMAIRGATELGIIRILKSCTFEDRKQLGKARSSDCDNMCRIYCDGVLVAGISAPDWVHRYWDRPSTICVVLNIRRTAETKLNLSRNDIAYGEHNWIKFVLQRCVNFLRKRVKQIVANESPKEALFRMARLVSYHGGFNMNLSDLIGDTAIPLLALEETGNVAVVRSTSLPTGFVYVVPELLARTLSKTIFGDWASKKWLQGQTTRISWYGGSCVFAEGMTYRDIINGFESIEAVRELSSAWLASSSDLMEVRFLSPGKEKELPLMQEIRLQKKFHNRKGKEYDQATEAVKTVLKANTNLKKLVMIQSAPKFVKFAAPFEKFFTAGWLYLNVLHLEAKELAECINAIVDVQLAGTISEHDMGTIQDSLSRLFAYISSSDYLSVNEINEKREEFRRLFDLTRQLEIFEVSPDLPWARKNVNVPSVVKAGRLGAPIKSLREVGLR